MKRYITAVIASAGLALGTISVLADPTDNTTTPPDQSGRAIDRAQVPSTPPADTTVSQQPSTTQGLPSQTQPGRALDRAALPDQLPANPAGGYAINEPAGAEESASSIRACAANPTTFVPKAFEADQAEIRMSQLAQEKSSSDQVKSLAQMIIQDHQAHADKVQRLAQQKGIQVSTQLSPDCQKKLDTLSALNGPSFDRHYVHDMVRDHRKAIALYDQAAANNTDPDVKALAQNTLPTLKEHLQMAQRDATTINEPAGADLQK